MLHKKLIDANICLRLIVQDHKAHSEIARTHFRHIADGEYIGIITPIIVAEIIYVLQSIYKYSREYIYRSLQIIMETKNVHIEETKVISETLAIYKTQNLDFADCYLLAKQKGGTYSEILTLDKKLKESSQQT